MVRTIRRAEDCKDDELAGLGVTGREVANCDPCIICYTIHVQGP